MYNNSVFIENLSKLIEYEKEAMNKTQNQIADEIGISTGALSKYLNGNATPKADVLFLLAKYFNVTTDYLLGLSDVKNNEELNGYKTYFLLQKDYKFENFELRQENLKLKKILLKNGLAKLRVKRNETN